MYDKTHWKKKKKKKWKKKKKKKKMLTPRKESYDQPR
ncbi:hypothetical protein G4228_004449 [Cervus hanglu yarkandensis]|nr:hypothetical protein G4228_004449 [Cervus hanglu yarkandensis]